MKLRINSRLRHLQTSNACAFIIAALTTAQMFLVANAAHKVETSTSISSTSSLSSSSTGTSSISSVSSIQEPPVTRNYVPITQHLPKIKKREDLLNSVDAKIKKTINIIDSINHTREALSHEGSEREQVVYLSDSSGYIPVTSLRRPSSPPSPYQQIDVDSWRPDPWDRDYNHRLRFNNTRVQHIEAECQDDFMKIRIGFNGSFAGLLYSAGYAYDPDCMYINGSGRDYYEFYIQLNRCGTLGKNALHEDSRKNPTKNFMWNTITVQYNPLIEEEFDEHFKVTCEYGYDFWKTVTFPFLDVEVATGNPVVFTLSPPECYMEIRNGYGVGGTRVSGPVRVGDPLTLIIYMRSKYDGFDIVVNDCYAHNGANKKIQLIDEYGCPVDDKLISRFRGSWSETGVYETQVFAYMKTFRFTGSPALYIECDVRMCHGRCPSQPCHWRNIKGISKREISNKTIEATPGNDTQEATLSDNISLFQSLRVLQEDEGDTEEQPESGRKISDVTETCVKTSLLSALTAGCCILLCILTGLLLAACAKLRYRKKESGVYDAYINHKGQID